MHLPCISSLSGADKRNGSFSDKKKSTLQDFGGMLNLDFWFFRKNSSTYPLIIRLELARPTILGHCHQHWHFGAHFAT